MQYSHIMLYVNDMERAAGWYRNVLGFAVQYMAAPHYATLRHESMDLRLDLHPDPGGHNVGHGAMIYFTDPDLDAAVALLRRQGVHVSEPRSRGNSPRFTEFVDSEGNVLGLYETPSAAAHRY